jgi:hypothetical protein
MNRLHTLALGGLAAVALTASAAVPAQASTPPPDFEAAQVGLTYSVYGPTQTLGMTMKTFKLMPCGGGRDEMIYSRYAASGGVSVDINESQQGCYDGPWPVVLVKTFNVKGAKAKLYAGCPGSPSSCSKANSNVKRDGGYLVVNLPSGGNGLSKTFTELYTDGLSASDVKSFARGLSFVG